MVNKQNDHKEQDLKLELSSANDHKTKLTQLVEERSGEIQRVYLEKRLLKEEPELERAEKKSSSRMFSPLIPYGRPLSMI